jgi:signal peptidase I
VRAQIPGTALRWLLPLLALALAIREWVWTPTLITGESMQPTLLDGQLAWINKLAYRFHPPRRGDIVVVRTRRHWIVKRILGLPGEEIGVRDGVCYINGHPLAEPYVQFPGTDSTAPGRLGRGRYLVAGDYRAASMIAVVSRDRIVGGLVFRQRRTPNEESAQSLLQNWFLPMLLIQRADPFGGSG